MEIAGKNIKGPFVFKRKKKSKVDQVNEFFSQNTNNEAPQDAMFCPNQEKTSVVNEETTVEYTRVRSSTNNKCKNNRKRNNPDKIFQNINCRTIVKEDENRANNCKLQSQLNPSNDDQMSKENEKTDHVPTSTISAVNKKTGKNKSKKNKKIKSERKAKQNNKIDRSFNEIYKKKYWSILEMYSLIIDDHLPEKMKDFSEAIRFHFNIKLLKQTDFYSYPLMRCAYLYIFGTFNTFVVSSCFEKLLQNASVRNQLTSKCSLKICCLGGGSAVEAVGILKVIAQNRQLHRKIDKFTVLDACSGWKETFQRIMAYLRAGKIQDIPSAVVNFNTFKTEFKEIDLVRQTLPLDVLEVIYESDIICMLNFWPAMRNNDKSRNALKVIQENLKLGAIVLCIDSKHDINSKLREEDFIHNVSLQKIIGPMDDLLSYAPEQCVPKMKYLNNKLPDVCNVSRVTMIGYIKKSQPVSQGAYYYNPKYFGLDRWREEITFPLKSRIRKRIKKQRRIH